MTPNALGRWLHALTHRDEHKSQDMQSARQLDLSREHLRQVQARLDALQMMADIQTDRRREEREGHRGRP